MLDNYIKNEVYVNLSGVYTPQRSMSILKHEMYQSKLMQLEEDINTLIDKVSEEIIRKELNEELLRNERV